MAALFFFFDGLRRLDSFGGLFRLYFLFGLLMSGSRCPAYLRFSLFFSAR